MDVRPKIAGQAQVVLQCSHHKWVLEEFDCIELFFSCGQAQCIDFLAKQPYVRIVGKGFCWFNRDIVGDKYFKKDTKF